MSSEEENSMDMSLDKRNTFAPPNPDSLAFVPALFEDFPSLEEYLQRFAPNDYKWALADRFHGLRLPRKNSVIDCDVNRLAF